MAPAGQQPMPQPAAARTSFRPVGVDLPRLCTPLFLLLTALPVFAGEAIRHVIDPATSTAGFSLKAFLHTVRGVSEEVEGEFLLIPSAGNGWRLEGEIRVHVAGLATGNRRRDRRMQDESLGLARTPFLRFRPQQATGGVDGAGEMTLRGELEIRGVTRAWEVPVRVQRQGDRIVVDATFTVPFLEFGVPDPSTAFLRVSKFVEAFVHLEAIAQPKSPR